MNKAFKRLVFLVAILTVVASMLVGCSSSNAPANSQGNAKGNSNAKGGSGGLPNNGYAMDNYRAGMQFKAKKPFKLPIMILSNPAYPYKKNWLFWKALKKKTNVTVEPTVIPYSDYNKKRSLLINSGKAPAIIPKSYPGSMTQFLASGALLPINKYAKYMPNYMNHVKNWNAQSYIDTLKQVNGNYYILPGIHQVSPGDNYTLAFRADILKKNNIPVPQSWADVKKVLEKLKKIYPNKIPWSDRWQFNATLSFAAPAFGTQAGWGLGDGIWYDKKQDKFVFAPATDNYKRLVTYFHSLVKEGLLDKASFTQNDDKAVQNFESGKSFFISTNPSTLNIYRADMSKTLGKGNFSVEQTLPPAGPAGPIVGGGKLENGIVIMANAKNKPYFKAMLQFIDWLWYSHDGKVFSKWGVKGKTYKVVNGKKVLNKNISMLGLNPGAPKQLQKDYGFYNGVFAYGGSTKYNQSMMDKQEVAWENQLHKKRKFQKPAPPHPYTQAERQQASLLQTPLIDFVNTETLKFITGERPLSQWNQYVQQLKAKGMDQYVKIANQAYQNYKKKNG